MQHLEIFFNQMEALVLKDPEGADQAVWAISLRPCDSPILFRDEAIWVIFCSGICYWAARTMQQRFQETGVCKHPHKAKAIKAWEEKYAQWWERYVSCPTEKARLGFLRTLPYFGGKALVYQLAKNLGITGYCKPDVHLNRLAENLGYVVDGQPTPQSMCEQMAKQQGCTVAYVDTILWFSAMRGWAYNFLQRGSKNDAC